MKHIFTLKTNIARCAHCGTVSIDGKCDCTKTDCPWNPAWEPYDDEACDEIAKLRAENKALREDLETRHHQNEILCDHLAQAREENKALREALSAALHKDKAQ